MISLLEVLHALFGLVRGSPLAALLQWTGRSNVLFNVILIRSCSRQRMILPPPAPRPPTACDLAIFTSGAAAIAQSIGV